MSSPRFSISVRSAPSVCQTRSRAHYTLRLLIQTRICYSLSPAIISLLLPFSILSPLFSSLPMHPISLLRRIHLSTSFTLFPHSKLSLYIPCNTPLTRPTHVLQGLSHPPQKMSVCCMFPFTIIPTPTTYATTIYRTFLFLSRVLLRILFCTTSLCVS
ncbi:hypothetical protein SCHPADRAFT_228889 [Schizopora paradoxa]|uniref:Uncharacterized protein n=1 Tax=Schizopora paradoxa TaxID=27342 RepID=A0A0H2RVN8_9AGAM|nr:hypothetical protein SCHPADRAFT_228889 [Schizopora paradoxa]